jgi:hypothetical protein
MLRCDPAQKVAGTLEQANRPTTATIEELHRRSPARVQLAWNGNAKERRILKGAFGHEYESEAETVRKISRRIIVICGRRPIFEDSIQGGNCDITLRTRSGIWRWEVKGATDWTARHHARHLDYLLLAAFTKEIGRMRGEQGRRWITFVHTFAHPRLSEPHALAMTMERFAEVRKIAAVDANLRLVLRPTWWRPVDQWRLKHDLMLPA